MINIKLGKVLFVNAELHLRLGISYSFLDFMPCVVFELVIFNLKSYVEKWLDIPVVDNVKKDGDCSKDPENQSDSDEHVGPKCEVIVTFSSREENVVDSYFR